MSIPEPEAPILPQTTPSPAPIFPAFLRPGSRGKESPERTRGSGTGGTDCTRAHRIFVQLSKPNMMLCTMQSQMVQGTTPYQLPITP